MADYFTNDAATNARTFIDCPADENDSPSMN